tara:strand:+ start:648 stop:1367 length:720 start_codon:yes stop_codon:yes gene_type:complete
MDVIKYSLNSSVATISLNRPEVINAFSIQMRDELYEYMRLFQDDEEAKVAIIKGNGERGFCAGADLSEFGTAPSQIMARNIRFSRDLWSLFLDIKKPIIAAMHGFVIGSGIEIAALCDIRIAAENACFRMPEAALGMIPAAGGTQMLPRLIGVDATLDLLLTNREISANYAQSIGLIDIVVEQDQIYNEAFRLAEKLIGNGDKLNASIKSAVRAGFEMNIDSALKLEYRTVLGLHGMKP